MAAGSQNAAEVRASPPEVEAAPPPSGPAQPLTDPGAVKGQPSVPVDHLVRDIRDGLSQISSRELDLRRRELDFDRQYQDLKREARQAAAAEVEQTQRQLAQQTAELNAQAVEISARRARFGELTEQLRAGQLELEQQRTDLALRTQQSRQRAERLRTWEARQRELLEERAKAIQRQEEEFRKRVQLAHQGITRQRREIEQHQAELEARAAALEQSERELGERQATLERRLRQGEVLATEVEQHHGELNVARDWLEQERNDLERAAEEVKTERARVAREWDQLEAASHELVAERKRLSERHAELEKASGSFDAERQRLTDERRQLEEARRALESEQAGLGRQRAELDERKSTTEIERVELSQQRRQLGQVSKELKTAQEAVRKKQEELDRRWRETHALGHRAQRQLEEFEASRRTLAQEQAALDERSQRLARREEQFREKAAALEAEKDRLGQWEAELETRRETMTSSLDQTRQVEAEAKRQRDEVMALREQAESREREARQTALSLEVDRQAMETARAATEADLDRQRAALQAEQSATHVELARQTESLRSQMEQQRGLPRRWWVRSAVLAVVAAGLAAGAWLAGHPATHRATAAFHIVSADPALSEVVSRHRRHLLDADLLADAPGGLAGAWRQACEQNRAAVAADEGDPVLRLTLTSPGAEAARRLLRAAADAYVRRVESGATAAELPAAHADLVSRRAALEAALQELRQKQAADETETVPEPNRDREGAGPSYPRNEASATADRLEAELTELTKLLEQQRGELAAFVSADVPRGSVAPADVDRALAEDAIYREDREEFRAVALQYRTELTVAMLQLVDPAKAVDKALAKLAAVLDEQRGLDPPVDIRAALEQCAADTAQAQGPLASFVGQWHAWLDAVRTLDVREDVVALVTQQNAAADAARRQADAIVGLIDELGARIDGLNSAGTGGTREVVVVAVLRSEHSALAAAGEVLLGAAARMSPTDNIELDAHDRKLRGLRTRVAQRREAVTQQLQLAADLAARDAHVASVELVRTEVRRLERRREELVTSLMSTLQKLRGLDEAARRRGELAVQTQQRAAEIAWLQRRHGDLDAEINALLQRQSQLDRVEAGEITVDRVSSRPFGSAALAGVATFVATWLICLLLVAPGFRSWTAAAAPRRPAPDSGRAPAGS